MERVDCLLKGKIEAFVRSRIQDEFVDLHIKLVVKETKWLCKFYPKADKEIVETAAWLHDVGQTWFGKPPYKNWKNNEEHHLLGKKISEEFLVSIAFPKNKIAKVLHCIESHRTSKPPEPKTIEAKIVASADNLAHFTGFEYLRQNPGEKAFAKLERDLKSKFMLPEAVAKAKKLYKKIAKKQNSIEYSYFVDKNDKVLGKISREEVHQKRLLHRAGIVFVFNSKGKVFLAKRSPEKKIFPNCIDCACSFHVQYGQTYAEAAKDELFEETKIRGNPKSLGKFVLDKDPDHLIVAVFKIVHNGKIVLDKSEAIGGAFFSFGEADRIIKNKKTTHWLPEAWKIYKKKK